MKKEGTKPTLIEFKKIGDSSLGYISVAEIQDTIPFEIKRVYWTYYTPDHVHRGAHAHKKLQQVLVAVSGSIEIVLKDKYGKEYVYKLDNPSAGLFVPEGYWRDLKFSHNAVLVCIASDIFKEDDYIRDFSKFIK
ncbi:FdtA/QdtA family cupin domain-containing protein [Lutibacter sp.]|uniref:sugar 3,4-ketoisomerase n=1 Tax=Lutibacter sp. TaxID=1925666 RepID=UPI0027364245|nr:FdtA/QdtA family cupin domain-containing protein [Lutibacter sp.]MDP3312578.1 FdtA/QdtA family cupin domain-containing protein [Lutibacter sp.]